MLLGRLLHIFWEIRPSMAENVSKKNSVQCKEWNQMERERDMKASLPCFLLILSDLMAFSTNTGMADTVSLTRIFTHYVLLDFSIYISHR